MAISSPLKYMGNKYELMPIIIGNMPDKMPKVALDAFGGSGVVSASLSNLGINTYYSETNPNTFGMVMALASHSPKTVRKRIMDLTRKFDLSTDNEEGFLALREYANKKRDYLTFWVCARHAHSNLMRFNGSGEFNVKFGKRALAHRIDDVMAEVSLFHSAMQSVQMQQGSYAHLLKSLARRSRLFVYLDPPYLASGANIYGKWSEDDEIKLLRNIKRLDNLGINFMLSNVTHHRDMTNRVLLEFLRQNKQLNVIDIHKTYTLANNVSDSYGTREILVTNY